ncbi:Glucose-1-phosphate cytidylyltransferase [compost metagenome]
MSRFQEKPAGDGAWINGGYFVLNPSVIDAIDGDQTSWEGDPLIELAAQDKLMVYRHRGFWQAMDTLRDKNQLDHLWAQGNPPWKTWA